jgi:hypothetical protein
VYRDRQIHGTDESLSDMRGVISLRVYIGQRFTTNIVRFGFALAGAARKDFSQGLRAKKRAEGLEASARFMSHLEAEPEKFRRSASGNINFVTDRAPPKR